jgi:hypothetical protein
MKVRALVVLAALIFGACNQQEPPPAPGSFDRPSRVAFVCFDMANLELPRPTELSKCDLNPASGIGTTNYWLHALVLQSSRGEVAAVDLHVGQTLDSRRDIPGYTFLPAGELPSAIAVPAQDKHSMFTYVANTGSRDITVLNTRAFRVLGPDERPTLQTVPLPGGSHDEPHDMLLSPDEDALFVTVPDTGRLLRLPIHRCDGMCPEEGMIDVDGITEFPLARSRELAVASPGGDAGHDPYAQACFYERPIPNTTVALPAPAADGPPPQPSGLALDDFCEVDKPCRRRLLVADAAQPLIHVIDLEELAASGVDAAVQPPILTGAPTLKVAVTPRVPADASSEAAETQYVYAIDARDGSVLVTENGKLLEVGTGTERRDRVTLEASATLAHALSLAVLTPAFDVHGPAAQYTMESPNPSTNPPDATKGNYCVDTFFPVRDPRRLRGVFLAVGATDGTVRIVDVHDMDVAKCRNCEQGYKEGCVCGAGSKSNACEACAVSWDPYPLVRHRTRITEAPNPEVPQPKLGPTSTPAFIDGPLVSVVRTTGTTADPNIKGLECVRCGQGQEPAFPPDAPPPPDTEDGMAEPPDITDPCMAGAARVCALADPWVDVEDWRATYKGALPGARGGQGRLAMAEDGTPEFRGEIHFCSLGVLGMDELAGHAGDQVTILGELAPDGIIRETPPHAEKNSAEFENKALANCKELVERRDRSEDKIPIAFEVRAAYADRLVIAPRLSSRPADIDPAFENDVDLVNKCFGNMLLTYELRAGSGYAVVGVNTTGFEHRVKAADGSGHCEQDPGIDPKRNGRAYEGEPFDNGRVAFQIAAGSAPQLDTILSLGLRPSAAKAELNASIQVNEQVVASLPVDLRWSNGDFRLYMVDIAYHGLVPIRVAPLDAVVGISFQ